MEMEDSNVPISLVSSNTLDRKIKKEAIVHQSSWCDSHFSGYSYCMEYGCP